MSIVGSQADGGCDNDLQSLISECKQYVMFPANPKIPPSDGCCGVIKKANVPCLCAKVTKEIEKVVCMDKVVYVAEQCKRPFEHGFQCGSYRVPRK
uniref:Bifunctional inhibitor/plant lipid transfer protein/seed storage helical domain n=1 Tax=Saccharum hybrid cultivar R570 TaxID=131158 RepID=A0A059Q3E6_9POAL|nr:Bifunctional inhibitor/plant lipid transfer protein/seed storage helical domain [Saccharum hybrid cultivar R570]